MFKTTSSKALALSMTSPITDSQIYKFLDSQTHRLPDPLIHRLTDSQTHILTDSHTHRLRTRQRAPELEFIIDSQNLGVADVHNHALTDL